MFELRLNGEQYVNTPQSLSWIVYLEKDSGVHPKIIQENQEKYGVVDITRGLYGGHHYCTFYFESEEELNLFAMKHL